MDGANPALGQVTKIFRNHRPARGVYLVPEEMRLPPIVEQGSPATYQTGQALLTEFEQTGAEKAFEEIVRLYAGMVYSVCQQVTKNAHDAEDATQATFLALATQVKLGKQVKCLGPWLRQVAKRTSLDLCKSRKRREKREANHNQFAGVDRFNGNAGEANLESQDYKTALHDELNRLPTRYRLPLVMHYFGGLPPEQTAIELNCKPKTLAVRLHRGRKMLAAQLNRRGIFMGGEMLGIASAPMMYQMLGYGMAHSTAHAAFGLTSGMDITTMISTRVMALVNGSAKAALLAKIKFLAVILVLLSTVLTGAAQTIRAVGPTILHLPNIELNIREWIKPVFRLLMPGGKMVAQATTPATTSGAPQNDLAFGSSNRLSVAGTGVTLTVTLTSYDPANGQAGDYLLTPAPLASVNLPNNGSIQLRHTVTLSTVVAGASDVGDTIVATNDGSTTYHEFSVPTSPTPEPVGTAAVLFAGSFLFRRRSHPKHTAK